jgi:hypothetical protein
MYLRVCCKLVFIICYKNTSECIYCDCNGKTYNFLKYFPQESQVLAPIIILIILFFTLKIIVQHKEFTIKLFHNSLCSENVHSILHLLSRGCNDFRHNHVYITFPWVCVINFYSKKLYLRWKILLYHHTIQVSKRTILRCKLHEVSFISI